MEIGSLRPTQSQYQDFGDYLCEAHSWYKHLPLMNGARFVVFVARDAGLGRLVAVPRDGGPDGRSFSLETPREGSEFTDANPRLHHGWKTTRDYRVRFGHLDYSHCRDSGGPFPRDAGPPIHLPSDLVEQCGFTLYPYVSRGFILNWPMHEEALNSLRRGASHPAREAVLELVRLAEAHDPAMNELEGIEQDVASDLLSVRCGRKAWRAPQGLPGDPSPEMRRYLAIESELHRIAGILREQEAEKIRVALTRLDEWLMQDRPQSFRYPPT